MRSGVGVFGTASCLLVFSFHPIVEAQLANSPWPMFHYSERHTGLSPLEGPPWPVLSWSYRAGADPFTSDPAHVQSAAVIGTDGSIYFGAGDHRFYTLDSDGMLVWSYRSGGYADYCAALGDDGSVYIASKDNNLYALSSGGALQWSYATGNMKVPFAYSSSTLSSDGRIYLASNDGNVYTFDTEGALVWSYGMGLGPAPSSPALDGYGTIYIGSRDTQMYALGSSGTLAWSYRTDAALYSSPAVGEGEGTVYFGAGSKYTSDYNIYALTSVGTLSWSYMAGESVDASPVIGNGGEIYVGSIDNRMYALSSVGAFLWSYETGGSIIEACAVVDSAGSVYFGSEDSYLYCLASNGSLIWSYPSGGWITDSSPALAADKRLYMGMQSQMVCIAGLPQPYIYWAMDAGEGSVIYDTRPDQWDGEIHGAAWTEGIFDNGLSFDGEDDYVDIGQALDCLTDQFTISAWVKPAECVIDLNIVGSVSDGEDRRISLRSNCFTIQPDGEYFVEACFSTLLEDELVHLVGVYDGSKIQVYKNGTCVATEAVSGSLEEGSTSGRIGSLGASFYFDGIIDEVRIYDVALTAGAIADLYD